METMTATETKSLLPTKGKITFAAFNPRTQMPVTCRPLRDSTGQTYTGQGREGYYESLTPEERRELSYVITPETAVTIDDGKVLNLDLSVDAANWKWLQRHPYLALDKTKKNRDTAFYLVNAEQESRIYVDRTAKIDQARPAVRGLSHEDQVRVAGALGLAAPQSFTPSQLLHWLLEKANTAPEAVLEAINPANSARVNATLFFQEIKRREVIARGTDGCWYFGGESGVNVGHNDETVIDWLLDKENIERVKAMKAMVVEKTKTAVSAE